MVAPIINQPTDFLESQSKSIKGDRLPDVKIVSLKSQDIKYFSSKNSEDNKLQFHDRLFVKGFSFSWQFRNSALQFCRQCLPSQLSFLFVENDSYCTIWLQQNPNLSPLL